MHHESWELVKGTVSKFQVSKLCYLHVFFLAVQPDEIVQYFQQHGLFRSCGQSFFGC